MPWVLISVNYVHCKYLLPDCGLSFDFVYSVFWCTEVVHFNIDKFTNMILHNLCVLLFLRKHLISSKIIRILVYF